MTPPDASPLSEELIGQRALWRRQSTTLPSLHGGKRSWFALVVELLRQIEDSTAVAIDATPDIPAAVFAPSASRRGARPVTAAGSWLEYSRFLKAIGLVNVLEGELRLSPTAEFFLSDPTESQLAVILAAHFRLFVESLAFVALAPSTVEEVDAHLRDQYATSWKSLGGTRERMDWLDALSLIQGSGGRRWKITPRGESVLSSCKIVSPAAIVTQSAHASTIRDAPDEIKRLLTELSTNVRTHESRSTYNIWVPSPPTKPNKVENLRTIVNAASDPIDREELLSFVAETFQLRRSSVDSMMPFLRASGLLHEVGAGVYEATTPAKAWLASGDDVNFIRILHGHMRFVGEMLRTVEPGVTRAEMYSESAKHGLNVDKSRWIASFLSDTGLVDHPRYGSIQATPSGVALISELPLASTPSSVVVPDETSASLPTINAPRAQLPVDLVALSRSPQALGLPSGRGFEDSVRDAFRELGFRAESVSGAGDTDIVVHWMDETGIERVAIVEAKSRSNGQVTHTDISDVALETHKSHNQADFAAVVGPAFAGGTIKNMAAKRKWALVEAEQLTRIVLAATELGLGPKTTGLLFRVPDGFSQLEEKIEARRRELSVVSFVIAMLAEEAGDTGDAITARDISRDGRRTQLRPSLDEVLLALRTVSHSSEEAVQVVQPNEDQRFSTYSLGDVRAAASQLRALANALEAGVANV